MKRIFLAGILFVFAVANGYADDALVLKKIDSEMNVIYKKLLKINEDIDQFFDTDDTFQALEFKNVCLSTFPHIVHIHSIIECYQTLECDTDKKKVMDCIYNEMAAYCIKYVNGHVQVVTEIIEVTQEPNLITLGETLKLQLRKLTTMLSEETVKVKGSNKE